MSEYLLKSATAKRLFDYAESFPIIDYHNHLSISDIAENKRYDNIYDLWIKPDPYKHRAMRMCGIDERLITGDGTRLEKFKAWCETLPQLIGNPLYVWSKMELYDIFGIEDMPDKNSAEDLYKKLNGYLAENEVTPKSLMERFNVEFACPCVSITDDISGFNGMFAPSLRGDDIVTLHKNFISELEKLTNKIESFEDFKTAIGKRLDELTKAGCRFTDHALDNGFKYTEDDGKNQERFKLLLNGEIDECDKEKLASYILTYLCGEYAKRNMTLQLHIGAQRYTSTRLRMLAGGAGGFAGIGNSVDIKSLTQMLDDIEKCENGLPKIVLFTLNPADNAMFSVLSGSYSKDGVKGLITQGPAWWWCDHKAGITDALENMAAFGTLSNFVGMTTDSRSFLSFVRHKYFRIILCNWLADKYYNNELCCTIEDLKKLIKKMCYQNARELKEV